MWGKQDIRRKWTVQCFCCTLNYVMSFSFSFFFFFRIDANVQDAELNVEAAHNEIIRYFQNITSNRWLMIKIFAVLIFFFLFFVIFMA